jgi:competence protein ComGC
MFPLLETPLTYTRAEPVIVVLMGVTIISLIVTVLLILRVHRLTRDGNGKSLEHIIHALHTQTKELQLAARKTEADIRMLQKKTARAIQGVALERFDPFQQNGGQQSFSATFIDEHGDGVIISGLHSRDQVRVYAKKVARFASLHELSEEEARSLKAAQDTLH